MDVLLLQSNTWLTWHGNVKYEKNIIDESYIDASVPIVYSTLSTRKT